MRAQVSRLLPIFAVSAVFTCFGCQEIKLFELDESSDGPIVIVVGSVFDLNGDPVQGAHVTLYESVSNATSASLVEDETHELAKAFTPAHGGFTFDVDTYEPKEKPFTYVKVEHPDFATVTRRVAYPKGTGDGRATAYVDVRLTPVTTEEFDLSSTDVCDDTSGEERCEVLTDDGLGLAFSRAALSKGGVAVSGTIQVRYAIVDSPTKLGAAPPLIGRTEGDTSGLDWLQSFGMVEVELLQEGEELDIEEPVTLSIPLSDEMKADLADGDPVGLYTFNDDQQVWERELVDGAGAEGAEGRVEDGRLIAEVHHFSWYNWDNPANKCIAVTGRMTFEEPDATVVGLASRDVYVQPVATTGEAYAVVMMSRTMGESTAYDDGDFCVVGAGLMNNRVTTVGSYVPCYYDGSSATCDDPASLTAGSYYEVTDPGNAASCDRELTKNFWYNLDSDPESVHAACLAWCDEIGAACVQDVAVPTGSLDQDGDGYLSEDAGGTDCDDTDTYEHPGAAEDCDDGENLDCVPGVDDDGDGVPCGADCENGDPGSAIELYVDGDQDGYGSTTIATFSDEEDEEDGCVAATTACSKLCGSTADGSWRTDGTDGQLACYTDTETLDPYDTEVCANARSERVAINSKDCNDDHDWIGAGVHYPDCDNDHYGNNYLDLDGYAVQPRVFIRSSETECPEEGPDEVYCGSGASTTAINWTMWTGDCLDSDTAVNPSATERENNGIDDDCDGTTNGYGWTGAVELPRPKDSTSSWTETDLSIVYPWAAGTGFGGECVALGANLYTGAPGKDTDGGTRVISGAVHILNENLTLSSVQSISFSGLTPGLFLAGNEAYEYELGWRLVGAPDSSYVILGGKTSVSVHSDLPTDGLTSTDIFECSTTDECESVRISGLTLEFDLAGGPEYEIAVDDDQFAIGNGASVTVYGMSSGLPEEVVTIEGVFLRDSEDVMKESYLSHGDKLAWLAWDDDSYLVSSSGADLWICKTGSDSPACDALSAGVDFDNALEGRVIVEVLGGALQSDGERDDVVVGLADDPAEAGSKPGAVCVLEGVDADGGVSTTQCVSPDDDRGSFGSALALLTFESGTSDLWPDILVGAPADGNVWLLRGSESGFDVTTDGKFVTFHVDDVGFGADVASAGAYFSGDENEDFIVAAPDAANSTGTSVYGAYYVISGKSW